MSNEALLEVVKEAETLASGLKNYRPLPWYTRWRIALLTWWRDLGTARALVRQLESVLLENAATLRRANELQAEVYEERRKNRSLQITNDQQAAELAVKDRQIELMVGFHEVNHQRVQAQIAIHVAEQQVALARAAQLKGI